MEEKKQKKLPTSDERKQENRGKYKKKEEKRIERTSMKIWWQMLTHKYTNTHILTTPTEQTSGPEWIMGN